MSMFKEYYKDPDFRKKHLEYIKTKVECKCGDLVSRCSKTKHLKSKKHTEWVKEHDIAKQVVKLLSHDQLLNLKNILINII